MVGLATGLCLLLAVTVTAEYTEEVIDLFLTGKEDRNVRLQPALDAVAAAAGAVPTRFFLSQAPALGRVILWSSPQNFAPLVPKVIEHGLDSHVQLKYQVPRNTSSIPTAVKTCDDSGALARFSLTFLDDGHTADRVDYRVDVRICVRAVEDATRAVERTIDTVRGTLTKFSVHVEDADGYSGNVRFFVFQNDTRGEVFAYRCPRAGEEAALLIQTTDREPFLAPGGQINLCYRSPRGDANITEDKIAVQVDVVDDSGVSMQPKTAPQAELRFAISGSIEASPVRALGREGERIRVGLAAQDGQQAHAPRRVVATVRGASWLNASAGPEGFQVELRNGSADLWYQSPPGFYNAHPSGVVLPGRALAASYVVRAGPDEAAANISVSVVPRGYHVPLALDGELPPPVDNYAALTRPLAIRRGGDEADMFYLLVRVYVAEGAPGAALRLDLEPQLALPAWTHAVDPVNETLRDLVRVADTRALAVAEPRLGDPVSQAEQGAKEIWLYSTRLALSAALGTLEVSGVRKLCAQVFQGDVEAAGLCLCSGCSDDAAGAPSEKEEVGGFGGGGGGALFSRLPVAATAALSGLAGLLVLRLLVAVRQRRQRAAARGAPSSSFFSSPLADRDAAKTAGWPDANVRYLVQT